MQKQSSPTRKSRCHGNASVNDLPKQLRFALNTIYGAENDFSELEALSVIEMLASDEYPAALFELGLLYWKGFVVAQDFKMAFRLISKAVEMDFIPAMSSLGGLYFSGIGCEQNFDKAMHWYAQGETNIPGYYNARIGAVALSKEEFRREFVVSISRIEHSIPIVLLEQLNQWRLACKKEVASEQLATLGRDPSAFSGAHKRCLPVKNSIGDSCIKFAGKQSIEKIGWRNSWLDEEIWFPLSEFGFKHSELPLFSRLKDLGVNDNGLNWSLDDETARRIQMAMSPYSQMPVTSDFRKSQNSPPREIELSVIFTADGTMGNFGFQGDSELLSFDNTHRKLLRVGN